MNKKTIKSELQTTGAIDVT